MLRWGKTLFAPVAEFHRMECSNVRLFAPLFACLIVGFRSSFVFKSLVNASTPQTNC